MPLYFAYGSNSIELLEKRVEATDLVVTPAFLVDYTRIFAGYGRRWKGAVATVIPDTGGVVLGTVTHLTDEQLQKLDPYEHTVPNDPESHRGYYRREKLPIQLFHGMDREPSHPKWAHVYILNTPFTQHQHPPTDAYLAACHRNTAPHWQGLDGCGIDVRDHNLRHLHTWYPPKK